jgi:hypothetical protein
MDTRVEPAYDAVLSRVPDAVQRFFSGAPQSRDRTKHRSAMVGLDPAIHLLRKIVLKGDGYAGQARA